MNKECDDEANPSDNAECDQPLDPALAAKLQNLRDELSEQLTRNDEVARTRQIQETEERKRVLIERDRRFLPVIGAFFGHGLPFSASSYKNASRMALLWMVLSPGPVAITAGSLAGWAAWHEMKNQTDEIKRQTVAVEVQNEKFDHQLRQDADAEYRSRKTQLLGVLYDHSDKGEVEAEGSKWRSSDRARVDAASTYADLQAARRAAGYSMEVVNLEYVELLRPMFRNSDLAESRFRFAVLEHAVFSSTGEPAGVYRYFPERESGRSGVDRDLIRGAIPPGVQIDVNPSGYKVAGAIASGEALRYYSRLGPSGVQLDVVFSSAGERLGVDIDLRGADFSSVLAECVVFSRCDLTDAQFSNAVMRNATFANCHFENTVFYGAVMDGALFHNCTGRPDFSLSGLSGSKFLDCEFEGALFQQTDLQGVEIGSSRIVKADFSRSLIRGFKSVMSELIESTFIGAWVENDAESVFAPEGWLVDVPLWTDMRVHFYEGSLEMSVLEGVDLRRWSGLDTVDLSLVRVDDYTTWPGVGMESWKYGDRIPEGYNQASSLLRSP